MTYQLIVINFGFVLVFGVILALSFSGITFRENTKFHITLCALFGSLQSIAYLLLGSDFVFKAYPILIHLPLFFVLKYYCKKNTYIAAIAVLSAYLFCTPRKWAGTFIGSLFNNDIDISYIVQILITLPLLWVIIHYVSAHVVRLQFEDNRILRLFMSVPLVYYCLEYALTVYTDLLYTGGAAIVEFMDASIVVVYFLFSVIYLKILYEKKELELEHTTLKLLSMQSEVEIQNLKEVQTQGAIYRHDLRHHLNFLNSCLHQDNTADAKDYIQELFIQMDTHSIKAYSSNESINLILSSYLGKADKQKIRSEVVISATDFERFSIFDLCSLLSNALENAIHACEQVPDLDQRYIKLRLFNKKNKLCLDIQNTFSKEPIFENNHPVSCKSNHGFGTKSMVYIVTKYNGIHQFSTKDNLFIFQATL